MQTEAGGLRSAPRRGLGTTARILEISAYPPPRAGWSMRVELLKKQLQADGHECVVLNIGKSRFIPSPEYETCVSGWDYVRKVWKFSRAGFVVHAHVNGDSAKGFILTLTAELLSLLAGRRCLLTFHAGIDQVYFPRSKAPLLVPMFWLMFAIPSRIVCNSSAVKAKILEYGVSGDKVLPIPAFSRQYVHFTPAPLPQPVEALYRRFPIVLLAYVRIRGGFYLDVLIEGFAALARQRPEAALFLLGVVDDVDPILWRDLQSRIERHDLATRICLWDDLAHEAFLTALARASVYLRTPTSDGIASSVLEALALGVPVVAAENGTRPAGVTTYRADDPGDLAAKVEHVLDERDAVVRSMPRPEIRDTLADEVAVLVEASTTEQPRRASLERAGSR